MVKCDSIFSFISRLRKGLAGGAFPHLRAACSGPAGLRDACLRKDGEMLLQRGILKTNCRVREIMPKYKVIARAIDSRCPQVQVGDRIVIDGTMLNLEESKNVCTVALGAIQYSLFMMGKANDPREFGRPTSNTLQCPDPDTRVIFEVSRQPIGE